MTRVGPSALVKHILGFLTRRDQGGAAARALRARARGSASRLSLARAYGLPLAAARTRDAELLQAAASLVGGGPWTQIADVAGQLLERTFPGKAVLHVDNN